MAVIAFMGIIIALMLRICLSVAITKMVIPHHAKNVTKGAGACPLDKEALQKEKEEKEKGSEFERFDWDESTQGLILGSFYIGYVSTHVPGGYLSDRYGGKYTLGIGILFTSVLTLLVPVAAKAGWQWLVVTRVFTGMGEGPTFPAVSALLAKWIPVTERSFFGALVFTGALIGNMLGNLLAGMLLHEYPGNWPLVFYIFGSLGLVWYIFWQILCYSAPKTHPCITEKEKNFLKEIIGEQEMYRKVPWKGILTSCPVWALVAAQTGHDWAFFTMSADLPKYMADVLNYPVKQNALYSSLPWFCMWVVALLSGLLGDYLIKKKKMSLTALRKMFTCIAHTGPAIGMVAASYAGCNRGLVVALFTLSMAIMGTFYPGMRVNSIDISPNFSGTVMAFVNGLGAITGFFAPWINGLLTPTRSLYEWRIVYWVAGVMNLLTVFVFGFFATAKVQPWNEIPDEEERRRRNNN